jgi:hypothetical protein
MTFASGGARREKRKLLTTASYATMGTVGATCWKNALMSPGNSAGCGCASWLGSNRRGMGRRAAACDREGSTGLRHVHIPVSRVSIMRLSRITDLNEPIEAPVDPTGVIIE